MSEQVRIYHVDRVTSDLGALIITDEKNHTLESDFVGSHLFSITEQGVEGMHIGILGSNPVVMCDNYGHMTGYSEDLLQPGTQVYIANPRPDNPVSEQETGAHIPHLIFKIKEVSIIQREKYDAFVEECNKQIGNYYKKTSEIRNEIDSEKVQAKQDYNRSKAELDRNYEQTLSGLEAKQETQIAEIDRPDIIKMFEQAQEE